MALLPQPEVDSLLADEDVECFLAYENYGRYHDDLQDAAGQEQQTIQRKPVQETVTADPVSSDLGLKGSVKQTDNKVELGSTRDAPPPAYDGDAWSPGFWRQFPYGGTLALLGCLACIVASIVVLVVSEGQPTSVWTVSPTVYLASLMTATNMLARFAFKEGVKIAWWYKALQGGTFGDLHHRWAHADGILSAVSSGRRFNLVTLGSIAVTVLVIDQPLIQRASSVITVSRLLPVNVTAPIAPEVPWGFTAYEVGRATSQQLMTQPMIAAFNDFNSQTPITTSFSGCKDTCMGYVEAGGLSAKCNTTSGPVSYGGLNSDYAGTTVSPFSVTFDITEAGDGSNNPSYITLNVVYSNNTNSDCSGTLTQRTCYLAPATLRYPVKLAGNILTIGDILNNGTTQSFQPSPPLAGTYFSESGGIDDGGEYHFWTVGGIYLAAVNLFSSNATYTAGGGISIYLTLPDTLSNQFLDFPPENVSGLQGSWNLSVPNHCSQNWTDPTSYILSSLNAMAFRLSLSAASFPFRNTSSPPTPQVQVMYQTSNINVYHSEYRFLIASTLLAAVCTVLIWPTFAGWWKLGRCVTLNPIETAKAFDAPLLQGPGSNAPLSKLVRRMGARELQLGEVEDYASAPVVSKLKFADPVEVKRPRSGFVYT